MFYNSTFLNLIGSVPPEAPPAPTQISLSPANPGDMGVAPQKWTTEITAPGLAQVKYFVGVEGAKTIEFLRTAPNNTSVVGYNHGDTINFVGYGTNFVLSKDPSGPYAFRAQGSNGFTVFTIGTETKVSDVRYTVEGLGGTGPADYVLLNLTDGKASLTVDFVRAGDSLIVKSTDETLKAVSGAVQFSGNPLKSIKMFPKNPGDLLTSPASWTTQVNVVGLDQVKWIVLDANWVGRTGLTTVNVVNNAVTITANFTKVGERLVVKSLDDTVEDVSGQVSFSSMPQSITMNPTAPGSLGTPPKTWQTTVTVANMAQVKWVVTDSNEVPLGNWTVVNVGSVSNAATITATFTASGQKLVVRSIDDKIQAVSQAVTLSTEPSPTTDYQFVYDYRKDLTVGVNIERGAGAGLTQSYFNELKADSNATHVRFFAPGTLDWGWPSAAYVNQFYDSCAAAIAAGFKVMIGMMDVVWERDIVAASADTYIRMTATEAAKRNFDPRKFVIAPWNELADSTNAFANPWRVKWTKTYRDALGPNYIIMTASSYWGDPNRMRDGTLEILADKRTIYEWHIYPWDGEKLSVTQDLENKVMTWETANNVITINGEYGKGGGTDLDGVQPKWIPQVIDVASRGMPKSRPNFWCITNQTYYRMNRSDSLRLTPEIATALRAGNSNIRAQPWFGT